jgi:hypothetical protein
LVVNSVQSEIIHSLVKWSERDSLRLTQSLFSSRPCTLLHSPSSILSKKYRKESEQVGSFRQNYSFEKWNEFQLKSHYTSTQLSDSSIKGSIATHSYDRFQCYPFLWDDSIESGDDVRPLGWVPACLPGLVVYSW